MTNRSMTSTGSSNFNPSIKQTVDQLQELGTFGKATVEELRLVAEAGRLVSVPEGWSLIWEKTSPDKAYVVLAGQVDVRRAGELVAQLGAGDVIGEVAIVQNRLRTATVVAGAGLQVLHFTKDAVDRLYAEVPAFRTALNRATTEHA